MDIWDEEYAKWRAECDRVNAYRRKRRATDPAYRERYNRYQREYQRRRREASSTSWPATTTRVPAPKSSWGG